MALRRALGVGLATALGSGCITAELTDGNVVPAERVAQIRPGETTRDEILEWFGAPESFTEPGELRRLLEESELLPEEALALPFADVLVFQLTKARLRGILLLAYNRIEVRSASDRLVVFFDERDRVAHYGFRRGTDALE
jgi:hypothetical protein